MTAPTLLLIDVGNSRLKYARHLPDQPILADSEIPAIAHNGALPSDPLRHAWQQDNEQYGSPDEIRISHVASAELYAQLTALCAELWPCATIRRIRPQTQHPQLHLGYDERQMGSDRYAQILGAQQLCPTQAHVVISAGTALTLDAVAAHGEHLGGTISAGLRLMRTALHQYTAQLPLDGGDVQWQDAPHNTRDALATGAMLSAVGAITQFVSRYSLSATPVELLFCGGDGLSLMQACQSTPALAEHPMRHAPALCLLGLLAM